MPNTMVLCLAKVPSIETVLVQEHLWWTGHVMTMDNTKILEKLLLQASTGRVDKTNDIRIV